VISWLVLAKLFSRQSFEESGTSLEWVG